MGLEIFWSEFAKLKLEEIYQYYRLKASKKVAKKIANGICSNYQKNNGKNCTTQNGVYLPDFSTI